MATSPVPLWAQEMSPYHRGPTSAGVLVLAVVVVLVVFLLQVGAATYSGESAEPGWQSPACGELQRLQHHGVTSGPSYQRTTRACEANGGH
jgi:hypothetical protein